MSTALTNAKIEAALKQLPGWSLSHDTLTKTFRFGSFKEAVSFIVRVAMHAEEENHHPRIVNVYDAVTISLNTHDAGDKVTEKDVKLATKIAGFDWTSS